MVGVPGRSKGCQRCRRRKIKCDESKPECQKCVKAKVKCVVYTPKLLWRHTSTAPFAGTQDLLNSGQCRTLLHQRQAIVARVASSPPAQELNLSAFSENIVLTFMFTRQIWRAATNTWLQNAAIGKLGPLAQTSALALAQTNFGRLNHLSDVERQGVAKYGQCLRGLSNQLGKAQYHGPALLAPILVMMSQAVFMNDATGAASHVQGLAKILQVCGPQAFQQGPQHFFFKAVRMILLINALIMKRRLFLEAEEWCTIPWMNHSQEMLKPQECQLIDLLMRIPGLLEDCADVLSITEQNASKRRAMIGEIKSYLVTLYDWRWKWEAMFSHQVCIDPDFASPELEGGTGRLSRVRLAESQTAAELMLYNAALMWFMSLLTQLDPANVDTHMQESADIVENTAATTSTFQLLTQPNSKITLRAAALEICRLFEWVTRNHDCGKQPAFMFLFPMGLAMDCLGNEPLTLAWIKDLLKLGSMTASYPEDECHIGLKLVSGRIPTAMAHARINLFMLRLNTLRTSSCRDC